MPKASLEPAPPPEALKVTGANQPATKGTIAEDSWLVDWTYLVHYHSTMMKEFHVGSHEKFV